MLKSHLFSLLGVSLIVNLIWFAVIGWPARILYQQWQTLGDIGKGDELVAVGVLGATLAVGILSAPLSAYAMAVMIRLALRISRYGQRSPLGLRSAMGELWVPLAVTMRLTVLFILMGFTLFAVLMVGLFVVIALSLAMDPKQAVLLGTFGLGSILIAIVFLFQWLMWPVTFLIADERGNFAAAFSGGISLARQHRRLSLSLVTVYFVLATVGSLLLYVGQIVTTPVAMMALAIGYLQMTGGQRFLRS
ncbi:hypothetical protein SAMN06265222_10135 [Neorhodopirellula lusitana]|uniref:DUF4013 domain-containing protein n=1 Tax=Neorhodopirellula lusitana TaxID=445327 RepID=A0ABY1PP44_9BACT|nr:hypothetical protein [Neorhodopirellula lusitana]SMP37865.1 hypothetical protein SAMN06265222_10135 [Neorhodopirellula lusitana]